MTQAQSVIIGRSSYDQWLQSQSGGAFRGSRRLSVERILCPIDPSESSRVALRYAVTLAGAYGAELRALHVVDILSSTAATELPGNYVSVASADAREELKRSLEQFLGPVAIPGVSIHVELREGSAVGEILHEASSRADIVVMGTRGLTGIRRLVLGSTTESVLRSATCPVLTVPPHADAAPPANAAPFSRVLCPIDFSGPSLEALDLALALAQEFNGSLTLLYVLDPDSHDNGGRRLFELEREMRHLLRQLTPDDARKWCDPEEIILVGDDPVRAIVKVARDAESQLIVMGIRDRTALDRVLFASTTEGVVREARCPVLTIRAAESR